MLKRMPTSLPRRFLGATTSKREPWLTSLVFSVDGHFSVEPIRHGRG